MLPNTMAETLLPRDAEGIPSWAPLPQQALTGIPTGRLNLELPHNFPKCLLPVKDSQPPWSCHLCPESSLGESAGVDPTDHFYVLDWGEEGLPLKQGWVHYTEKRSGQGRAALTFLFLSQTTALTWTCCPLGGVQQDYQGNLQSLKPLAWLERTSFLSVYNARDLGCVSGCPASP